MSEEGKEKKEQEGRGLKVVKRYETYITVVKMEVF